MANVPQLTLAALLLCSLSGCITISINSGPKPPAKPTTPTATTAAPRKNGPARVVVRWLNEVGFAADTTRGGQLSPGMVGRMYLFGQDLSEPLEDDGAVEVELADASVTPPKPLESWNIDAPTVRLLLKKDGIGKGYSLFLPWGTFRPDLKRVEMKLVFKPTQGSPLYATPEVVNLSHGDMPTISTSYRTVPQFDGPAKPTVMPTR